MRKLSKQGQVMYGSIDRHFNADGHYVVAEHILPIVAQQLLGRRTRQ